jgi:hypothetical protein
MVFGIVLTVAFTPTPRSACGTLAIFSALLPGFGFEAYSFSAQVAQNTLPFFTIFTGAKSDIGFTACSSA